LVPGLFFVARERIELSTS